MTSITRRHFLLSSAALPLAIKASAQPSANNTIRVAVVGFNGRGRAHINAYLKMPNVEIAALCDVDASVVESGCKMIEGAGKKRPPTFSDYRKLLEDKTIDAVSLATPNFHHTLQTIWAVQAGKDVFVEKPCSYNMFEAQQIIAASRRYNRIVQDGTGAQGWLHEAKKKLADGLIGDVYMARGLCYKWRDTIGKAKEEPVPPGVAYDLWTGPAPTKPFTRNRFHYNWHWQWDYGNGDIGNQGVHEIDVARWGLGVKLPTRVHAAGGHFLFDDDQQTPNALMATFEFPNPHGAADKKKILQFEVRGWITNAEDPFFMPKRAASAPQNAGIGAGGYMSTSPENVVGNLFFGSKGYMVKDVAEWRAYLGDRREPGPTGRGEANHYAAFVNAIRDADPARFNANMDEAFYSCALIHLANISYRLGRSLDFDPETLTFRGDAEANRMLTREYRAPYVLPSS